MQSWLDLVKAIDPQLIRNATSALTRLVLPPQGMYEVLDYNAELVILDIYGEYALYSKQKKVKFLQNNIVAYQDIVWGDGKLFAKYKCSPGVAVDRYREGNIYNILIALRETKNFGDVEDFFIERTIKGGFTKQREYFQNIINHPMRHFSASVIFPKDRPPQQIVLIEHRKNRVIPLNSDNIHILSDGRQKVTWETNQPRLHELYGLRWDW